MHRVATLCSCNITTNSQYCDMTVVGKVSHFTLHYLEDLTSVFIVIIKTEQKTNSLV
jgi:hypothetical protein